MKKALLWDVFVDHALIDVEVKDGKVILSGTVGSAAEKHQASMDAHVHGVTSVDDTGLKVQKWARGQDLKGEKYVNKSEKEIKNAVEDALLYDPRVVSFDIMPEVDNAKVTLRGTVDNLKAKRAAGQDARNTVGVRTVDNRIKIRPPAPISDEKMEEEIKGTLRRNPYVEGYEITVDVRSGVAHLYGKVDTYFEMFQADDVASKVKGVVFVNNNLEVQENYDLYIYDPYVDDWYVYEYYRRHGTQYPDKTDSRIKADIEDQLWWSPFVDSDDVEVEVDQGTAILSGTVNSWSERNAAGINAFEGGAVRVDNDLTVK